MGLDLWNFDEKSLKKASQELPNRILKEQAEILSQKTDGVIYGKITNMKFCPKIYGIKYSLATVFDIVVPLLDNYNYTLLVIYSMVDRDYPVAITVGSSIFDDEDFFEPKYECNNREEFIQALKDILSSEEVNRKIRVLYAKANFE